jgi:hypothetical protein
MTWTRDCVQRLGFIVLERRIYPARKTCRNLVKVKRSLDIEFPEIGTFHIRSGLIRTCKPALGRTCMYAVMDKERKRKKKENARLHAPCNISPHRLGSPTGFRTLGSTFGLGDLPP